MPSTITTRHLPQITKRFIRTRPIHPIARRVLNATAKAKAPLDAPPEAPAPVAASPPPLSQPLPPSSPPPGLTKYAYRWETIEPTGEQRQHADEFFEKLPPKLLWTEAKFKNIDFGNAPEVAFLGRSNVGKSSLLNALLNNKHMAYTSSKPGRTRLMGAYAVGGGKLLLLDMPGYGHASREDWGVQVMKYLRSRKQLRRAYILIDSKHGPKSSDMMLLNTLSSEGIPFQIVLSKVDRLKREADLRACFEDTRKLIETGITGATALGEIIGTAAAARLSKERKAGITELRCSILAACGLEKTKW